MTEPTFTPTEELIIDVLIARFRLGDTLWNFESRNKPALRRLEDRGLIDTMSGPTENTILASLTDKTLHEHGPSWFRLSITMDRLPEGTSDDARGSHWTKSDLETLAGLPQQDCGTDPRAVNAAHLFMIGLISRHGPVFTASPGTHGAVLLSCNFKTVEILADGLTYRLHERGEVPVTTGRRDQALAFAFRM